MSSGPSVNRAEGVAVPDCECGATSHSKDAASKPTSGGTLSEGVVVVSLRDDAHAGISGSWRKELMRCMET